MMDVVVIGAGPAGVLAAIRAAELGARTALVTSAESGRHGRQRWTGSSTDPGVRRPIDPRARQLPRYGITATEPMLHYDRLLERMREVIDAQLLQAAVRAAVELKLPHST